MRALKSSITVDITLLEKYAETRDKEYLEQWYHSEESVIQAMRLANQTAASPYYKSVIGPYGGETLYATDIEVVNPDILSYAYEAIGEMLKTWEPEKSKFNTYVYKYGPHRLMRIRKKDQDNLKADVDYSELENYQNLVEDYHSYNNSKAKATSKLDYMEKEIEDNWSFYNKKVYQVMLGEIAQDRAIEEMNISESSFWYYRKQTVELLQEKFGGEIYGQE